MFINTDILQNYRLEEVSCEKHKAAKQTLKTATNVHANPRLSSSAFEQPGLSALRMRACCGNHYYHPSYHQLELRDRLYFILAYNVTHECSDRFTKPKAR